MFNKEDLYQKALKSYAGNHVFKLIKHNKDKQLELFMDKHDLTISFYDIVAYHGLPQSFDPSFIMNMLYTYCYSVFTAIENNNGVIINLSGDKIISVFMNTNHELQSIKAAFEAQNIFISEYKKAGLQISNIIGTGINTGEVLLGNLGTKKHLFYTIMGDNVNLASRLANSNQIYKTNIIISDFTKKRIKDNISTRELDKIKVMGLKEPHSIYEVISI